MVDLKLYHKVVGTDFLSLLSTRELVEELVRSIGDSASGKGSEFKYVHYSTHQETLGPLLSVIADQGLFKRSTPGSSLFIEYSKVEDMELVKMFYMEDSHTKAFEHTMTIE